MKQPMKRSVDAQWHAERAAKDALTPLTVPLSSPYDHLAPPPLSPEPSPYMTVKVGGSQDKRNRRQERGASFRYQATLSRTRPIVGLRWKGKAFPFQYVDPDPSRFQHGATAG
jgi:hypothetical protein